MLHAQKMVRFGVFRLAQFLGAALTHEGIEFPVLLKPARHHQEIEVRLYFRNLTVPMKGLSNVAGGLRAGLAE